MASAVRAEADHRVVGNLPLELTSFVGRRRELADARRLFESSRLLTLTGVGGAGKTRLAIRLAGALQRVFSDGTWLVELGELSDPDLLADYVAAPVRARQYRVRYFTRRKTSPELQWRGTSPRESRAWFW
ncbi:hypothetical protein N806_06655 [Rhodococcus sp. P27]|nr:hypothetical protein N806_00610 [Rhodococcus sp. P27]ERB50870.1 hypothetical protein N806_06655 [Rhodococcus sp. P27]